MWNHLLIILFILGYMMDISDYFRKLQGENPDVAIRYVEKIKIFGGIDPFTLKEMELNYDIESLPSVTSMDIVAYLVLTHSFYTKDEMKAYKSLQSFKYFEAGFVRQIGCKEVGDYVIVVGKVSGNTSTHEN